MIKVYNKGIILNKSGNNYKVTEVGERDVMKYKKNTIAYSILSSHNTSESEEELKIKFDALASHDITYVGIIQTAKASGLEKFPIPYVLTNCHNSLCAVGGTINEDDHVFGLSAAKKYGGIYVPPHQGVIHQYMREMMAGCGKMILGSDSHTRYGALGTMAIGEGGGELVKQLLGKTYDIAYPEVVGVRLVGKVKKGIGPQDVALAIIGKVFQKGLVKNKIMEFVGEGISELSVEFRNGIDVMTTETTCLSSIWETDSKVEEYLREHGRGEEYKKLSIKEDTYYDGFIEVDLSKIESMIALPFHPSNVYTIKELNENLDKILEETEKKAKKLGIDIDLKSKVVDGRLIADQGVIGGCAGGTYDNIIDTRDILNLKPVAKEFTLSIYPSSQPTYINLSKNNTTTDLMVSGAVVRSAFCGPCFGAGDTPGNNQLSIRHTTRNFPNREGSKPKDGQISSVALMDARSIAATAINGGKLTPGTDLEEVKYTKPEYEFDETIYKNKVYSGYSQEEELIEGPNIISWPEMPKLTENLLLKVAAYIGDPITTTDELIPSGEASSFRSNPHRLSEYTLSRRVPEYVEKAKVIRSYQERKDNGEDPFKSDMEMEEVLEKIKGIYQDIDSSSIGIGSTIYAVKPGDGSAREQAASCQKVLGGWGNIVQEYATKRYRSNLINWGVIPFIIKEETVFKEGDHIFIRDIDRSLALGEKVVKAHVIGDGTREIDLYLEDLSSEEREVLREGCLINYYRKQNRA